MKLFLLFCIGSDRYALDGGEVDEVLPLTALKQIPGAPPWVSGLLTRHGRPVPVIDLSALACGTPAAARTSTRTVLVRYRRAGEGAPRCLGLRVERATETLRCDPAEFVDGGIDPGEARYLGPVRADAAGLVQWVKVDALLPDAVHAMLFTEPAAP